MRIITQRKSETCLIDESTVHKPHGSDETYGTQHTDRREIFDGIQTIIFQNGKCYRIGQCDSRHIESHTHRIECNK